MRLTAVLTRIVVVASLLHPGLIPSHVLAQSGPSRPAEPGRIIAVVPFVNVTGNLTDDWIGPGIAESLVAGLGERADLTVVDSSYARDDLGAIFLVTGGYQRLGDRLRVIAQLVDVESGTNVTSTVVDGTYDELFELQDRVLANLLAGLDGRPASRLTNAPPHAVSPRVSSSAGDPTGGALAPFGGAPALVPGAPPPPVAPENIRRNDRGQATIRVVRLGGELDLDGILDEPVYQDIPAISDFVQVEPNIGEPATEKTETWLFFDDTSVYISARAWDSSPESQWIANEMRRDNFSILRNDNIGFAIDTFYDRRNSNLFTVTPLGGRMDGQVTNERNYNGDWNPIWDLRTGRFDGGWSFEAKIPFKSLRYRPGRTQVWGFQMRRNVVRKNETSFVIPLDQGLGQRGMFQASQFPTLVGLEAPQSGHLLEIKPYAIGDVNSNLTADPAVSNELGGNIGIDLIKYGVTQNLTADFTINTDFAQVEADEQQVNLTRFSLFFPEKREFFLENQGAFQFGTGGGRGRSSSADAPILFYSRRIGLSEGLEVPIIAGGRLTGRAGAFTVGVLNIQTNDEPTAEALSTNFSVVRVRRDLLRRSSFGAIFTNRSVSEESLIPGSNQAYGLDAALAFYDNLSINGYWAQTQTTGIRGEDTSYSGDLRYNGDRYGVIAEHLFIDRNFSPEIGFLRRDDMRKSFGSLRFSPRPQGIDSIRKFTFDGSYNYITDASGFVETREAQGLFEIELQNSDRFNTAYIQTYDFLREPFEISDGVVIPVGGYDFNITQLGYTFGSQRRLSGRLGVEHGSFYGGTKTTVTIGGSGRGPFGGGRVELTPQFSFEPGMSLNWVDLPQGDFTTTLVTTRATYTMTPQMFLSALIQYNSDDNALSTNIRLRWEYRPGSELFVVYNDQRDTLMPERYPELENRAFIIKFNRLFRF